RKVLVPGNHDRCWTGDRALRAGAPADLERRLAAARDRYLAAGFAEIRDSPVETVVGGRPVVLSHFPYEGDSHGEDRHVEHRPVHASWRQRGRQVNVGVDAWGGRPVAAETVAALVEEGPRELAPLPWS